MSAYYQPAWESLSAYTVPEWFRDAKLGIFIHWGVYSVPAWGNEWYPRKMYRRDDPEDGAFYRHHQATWGHPAAFGYKNFIPLFTGARWDPDAWLDLFVAAGARYVVPVGEHHDGFPMYATPFTPWNAAEMGPRRDVCAELMRATRERGLKFGVSSHRAFNWRYYTFEDPEGMPYDTADPANAGLYGRRHAADALADAHFLSDWFARTLHMMDRFEPDVLWFDFGWQSDEFERWRPQMVSEYYNRAAGWGKEVVLQYKDKLPDGVAVLDVERGKLPGIREGVWQTDTSVSERSWGYIENDTFKSTTTLIHDLVDIVSKNGNLLLNVGPRADGTIPDEAESRLRALGAWLAINGEAIYGTRPWRVYGEGPTPVGGGHFSERKNAPLTPLDIRYTARGNLLYAIVPGVPGPTVTLTALADQDERRPRRPDPVQVSLLGSDAPVPWRWTAAGLEITVPDQRPSEEAIAFRIAMG
jgi:alpha-L-fucosidase